MSQLAHPEPAPNVLEPPSAGGLPILGQLPAVQRDILGAFAEMAKRGDVVRVDFPRQTGYVLSHPDAVKHVLVDHHRNYDKQTRGYRILGLGLGKGLVTSTGRLWRRQRRIAQPIFHPRRIDRFLPVMDRAVNGMLDRWKEGRPSGGLLDTDAEMMRLTLEIVGRCLMSTDLSSDSDAVGAAISVVLSEIAWRMAHPFMLPYDFPTPRNLRMKRALREMHALVGRIVAERRSSDSAPDDLLQTFLSARDDETGEAMDDEQLRDEIMTMVSAGHETTANALTWALMYLADHPEARERLEAEVDAELAADVPVDAEALGRLPWCEAVIEEAMRLRPPVWMLARNVVEDDVVMGYRVRKGAYVFLPTYVLHRDPRFWEEPDRFRPERFFGEARRRISKHVYFPFAGGPRVCIGAAFAMMEAKVLLARITRVARLERSRPGHVGVQPTVTLRPAGGLAQRLRWRSREPLPVDRAGSPVA